MSDAAGIYVRFGKTISVANVRDAIIKYWSERGATVGEAATPGLASGSLSFVIAPPVGGWIAIADSERTTADFALAQFLAGALATQVCWFSLGEKNLLRVLGPGRRSRLPKDKRDEVMAYVDTKFPSLQYDVSAIADSERVSFTDINPRLYARGPVHDQ